MDLATFERLLTPEGQTALAAATALEPTDSNLLQVQTRLRKQFSVDMAMAVIETAILRRKAKSKFSRAERMYFTREGLEQSSGEIISSYRAKRFAGFELVADLCCGIGGDAIGLSQTTRIAAVDNDPVRLAMTKENLQAYDRADRASVILGDATSVSLPKATAAFVDPDRRTDGQRFVRLRDYSPPVEAVTSRFEKGFPIGIKVAPAAPWDDLNGFDAEKEFISVDGELKECVLWFGSMKSAERRATLLPGGDTLSADHVRDPHRPGPPKRYLYEPDPAIIRSGLVAQLSGVLSAHPIDREIAYLTSDQQLATPFARCFEILESMPFHARRIGERLKATDVGQVSIMKRGSAVDVDSLRRGWKLAGKASRTVILTQVLNKPWALIAVGPIKQSKMTAE